MNFVALRMLIGDRNKYLGILFGVAFATLLMAQQASIFCGLMLNTASVIYDAPGVDVWVMADGSRYIDDIRPVGDADLQRVRGVPGVKWAVPLTKNQIQAVTPTGRFEAVNLIGADDDSLIGVPREMVVGRLEDLRQPDAVIIDTYGFAYLFPDEPMRPGLTLEINDRRLVVVGVCRASPPFMTLPLLYTRYRNAVQIIPPTRRQMSYILVKTAEDAAPAAVAEDVTARTGLMAKTSDDFAWSTIGYYMDRTGIPVNFGITILLGFIVGCAICGQTFYLFVLENTKHFGMLKAMGVSNVRLAGMVMLQAGTVGSVGFGLGVGGACLAGLAMDTFITHVPPVFHMPWQVLVGSGFAVLLIIAVAGLLSLRRVWTLEPAIVFK